MSLDSKVPDLREKEQKVLRSFLVFSFMGSLVLHILVLTLSSLWFRTPKFAEKPIDVIIVDPPTLKAAKPKPKDKIVPIVNERRSDTHQSIKTIAASGASSVSHKGGIIGKSSAPSSQSTASQSAIAPLQPLVVSKKLSQPTKKATTHKPIVNKPPQLVEKPKLVSRSLTTLPPQPVETPNLAEALPSSFPTPLPESAQTSTPTNIATLPPKLVEATKPVPKPITTLTPKLAQIQPTKHELVPTPSLTATPKPTSTTNLSVPISSPQPQAIAENITHPPDTRDQGGNRKNVAIGSANRESRNSSGGTGTGALGHSNGSGSNLGTSSGNGSQVATGPGNGNGSSIGSNSDGVVCRHCPPPEYPPGAENLEARAVVVINVEKDGNVSNVEIVKSTGYDKLDQTVLETVKKKWKFASSEKEQRVRAGVSFALTGSDFYHQARKREHQARELEHQGKRERSLNP
ncbi:MAG: TonB family protein [Stigonema ocellatum SAG 48.90 = DSM 106950]|nr:TonB family protein [Stigonema ocellatum SAG 48.90 = DSM 106950]